MLEEARAAVKLFAFKSQVPSRSASRSRPSQYASNMSVMRPGGKRFIVAHHEDIFEGAACMTKLAGARADYTHLGLPSAAG